MQQGEQSHSSLCIGIDHGGILAPCSNTSVGYCLFDPRYSRTSTQINDSAPHFLFTHMPHRSRYGTKNSPNKMKNEKYIAPEAEVLEIAVEQGFAQSQLESPEEGEED